MASAPERHTVLLVEDEPHTRERLAEAIGAHPRLSLCGAVATCAEARQVLAGDPPDVLLTDIGLPDGSGIELIRAVRDGGDRTVAMVITVFGDEKHVVAAIEAGALGYVLKDGSPHDIAGAILDLIAGGSPISPPIARYFLRRFRGAEGEAAAAASAAPHLTAREREALRLFVKGFSYAEAARLMGVSETTVASHVRSVYRKLDVHSRSEAVYEALQLGLVKLNE